MNYGITKPLCQNNLDCYLQKKKSRNENEAFNNFEDNGFKPIVGPVIRNQVGTFRHHRGGPIPLPNRRNVLGVLIKKVKKLE